MKTILIMALIMSLTNPIPQKGATLCRINNDQIREFVSHHWKSSWELYRDKKIPMAISLSQWILESGYGTSSLAVKRKNIAGIMRYKDGVKSLARFKTWDDFYRAYGKVFERPCYQSLQPKTLQEWLRVLEFDCCGYATSREYKRKLERIIYRYGFDELPC
jgi:flagellum-specific peptidoglycan hydrolase FlgJ